jgi:hypothetical protein
MNFRIEDEGAGQSRLTTETRIFATDTATRRRFGLYWAFVYPGSALIRPGWLQAITKRAEAAPLRRTLLVAEGVDGIQGGRAQGGVEAR